MTCEHLRRLEQAIIAGGIRATFRGKAWSQNCREWVYFDCFIDIAAVRRALSFPSCIIEHSHRGTHDGQERGSIYMTVVVYLLRAEKFPDLPIDCHSNKTAQYRGVSYSLVTVTLRPC
jgi:hypothetical protein